MFKTAIAAATVATAANAWGQQDDYQTRDYQVADSYGRQDSYKNDYEVESYAPAKRSYGGYERKSSYGSPSRGYGRRSGYGNSSRSSSSRYDAAPKSRRGGYSAGLDKKFGDFGNKYESQGYGSGYSSKIDRRADALESSYDRKSYTGSDYGIGRKEIGNVYKGYQPKHRPSRKFQNKQRHTEYQFSYRQPHVEYEASQDGGHFRTKAAEGNFKIDAPQQRTRMYSGDVQEYGPRLGNAATRGQMSVWAPKLGFQSPEV